jgi:S1-C subfamily serine protease
VAAARAVRIGGIMAGDVITKVDGKSVPILDDYLVAILASDTAQIAYIRNGPWQTANVLVVDAGSLNFNL